MTPSTNRSEQREQVVKTLHYVGGPGWLRKT